MRMRRELSVTIDIYDDLLQAGVHFTPADLGAMMSYIASLGASRVAWIYDTIWSLYDADAPAGHDLLKTACDKAHQAGLRFDVVFKPFEGGLAHPSVVLPASFPVLAETPLLQEAGGLVHAVRPTVAEHPDWRLARPDWQEELPAVAAVRMVQQGDQPLRFDPNELALWTASINAHDSWRKHEGRLSIQESLDCRPESALGMPSRVITLHPSVLPGDTKLLRVQCPLADEAGTFTHDFGRLVELLDDRGRVIPCTPSPGRVNADLLFARTQAIHHLQLSRYLRLPQMQAWVDDREKFMRHCQGMYKFDTDGPPTQTLDRDGQAVVRLGVARHVVGALDPSLPQVRDHWLREIASCLDRGVDGVNIRLHSHHRPYQPEAYGLSATKQDSQSIPFQTAESNGDAFTLFLTQAAALIHQRGKELGVHVHGDGIPMDDRQGRLWASILQNIDWQWERWVRQLADYVEFRGVDMMRQENLSPLLARIARVTSEAGKPLFVQSTRGRSFLPMEGPATALEREMAWVSQLAGVTGYNLYELATFSRHRPGVGFQGSVDLARSIRAAWR